MPDVMIRGDGIAACCCAHLLRSAGFRVTVERSERPRLPAILLSDAALALIRDVFGQKDLFANLPRIKKRIVAWGRNSKPLVLDHSAVVVSEELLLKSIRTVENEFHPAEPTWTIFAARPMPLASVEHCFGSRSASAVPVTLKADCDSAACWIESLEDGWLFLIPNTPGSAYVLCVGGPSGALLDRSRIIADQIAVFSAPIGTFPAHPRITSPLCGPEWFACGTSAMAFDPLCGDGTAHAIREAILAAAAIRAISNGASQDELLSHYEMRLTAGFRRHLVLCNEFYRSGYGGPWWDSELESLQRGVEWCAREFAGRTEFRYRLNGFELQPLA